MTSALLAPYPSRRESTYASFEGSSSMGSAPAGFKGAPEGSARFEGNGRLSDVPSEDVRGNSDLP
jgi:hypothetical protein